MIKITVVVELTNQILWFSFVNIVQSGVVTLELFSTVCCIGKIKIDYNREIEVRFHVIMKYKTLTKIIIFTIREIKAPTETQRPTLSASEWYQNSEIIQ